MLIDQMLIALRCHVTSVATLEVPRVPHDSPAPDRGL